MAGDDTGAELQSGGRPARTFRHESEKKLISCWKLGKAVETREGTDDIL